MDPDSSQTRSRLRPVATASVYDIIIIKAPQQQQPSAAPARRPIIDQSDQRKAPTTRLLSSGWSEPSGVAAVCGLTGSAPSASRCFQRSGFNPASPPFVAIVGGARNVFSAESAGRQTRRSAVAVRPRPLAADRGRRPRWRSSD